MPFGAAGLVLVACFVPAFTLGAWAQKSGHERKAHAVAGPPRKLPSPRTHVVKVAVSDRTLVFSATPLGLFVSRDAGQSWAAVPVDGKHEEVFSVAVHPTDPAVMLAGRRDGLWKTADDGRTWAPLAYPTVGPYIPLAVAIASGHPNVLYLATAREGVFRSDDEGYRWANVSAGLPPAAAGGRPAEIRALAIDPRNPYTAYVGHERHGIYRTTDGGATWRPFGKGLPPPAWRPTSPPRFAFDSADPDRLYLVFAQPIHSRLVRSRVYVTSGEEWLPVEAALPPNTPIVELTVDPVTRALRFWTDDAVLELPPPPGQE